MSHDTLNSITILLIVVGQFVYNFYLNRKVDKIATGIKFDHAVNYPATWDAIDDLDARINSINQRLEHVVVKSATTRRTTAAKKAPAKKAAKKTTKK